MYMVGMGIYRDQKKIACPDLKDLHVFNARHYENSFWKAVLSLRMFRWICVSLAPEIWDGFCSYSEIPRLSVIGRCVRNYGSKIGALHM
jgi:hypothetical protein